MSLDYDPDRIIECDRAGDEAERTHVDPYRWEAAERIYAGIQSGKSKKQIGREINRSDMHVIYCERAWVANLGLPSEDRQRWNEAYQAAKGTKTHEPSTPVINRTASIDQVVEAIRSDPKLIQAILQAVKADRPKGPRPDTPDNGKLNAIYDLTGHLRAAIRHLEKAEQADEESWGGRADMALDAIETITTRLRETRNHVQAGSAGSEGGVPGVPGIAQPISLARVRSIRRTAAD